MLVRDSELAYAEVTRVARGPQKGSKKRCSVCRELGHTKPKCPRKDSINLDNSSSTVAPRTSDRERRAPQDNIYDYDSSESSSSSDFKGPDEYVSASNCQDYVEENVGDPYQYRIANEVVDLTRVEWSEETPRAATETLLPPFSPFVINCGLY